MIKLIKSIWVNGRIHKIHTRKRKRTNQERSTKRLEIQEKRIDEDKIPEEGVLVDISKEFQLKLLRRVMGRVRKHQWDKLKVTNFEKELWHQYLLYYMNFLICIDSYLLKNSLIVIGFLLFRNSLIFVNLFIFIKLLFNVVTTY